MSAKKTRPACLVQPQAQDREAWAALAQEHGLGFEALEFSLPPLLEDGALRAQAEDWYRNSGRTAALHGAFIDVNPASGDAQIAALSKARLRASCGTAKRIGAQHVIVHSSCFPFLRGAYLDTWAQRTAAFLEELARAYGLTLCLENSMDTDPAPLLAVMARVQDGRVGVCLDVGHAQYSRTPVDTWFEQLAPFIAHIHLSDNAGAFDDHLPLGGGCIDWAAADRCYRALGRSVPVTLEVGGIDTTRRSLAFLAAHGYFGWGE